MTDSQPKGVIIGEEAIYSSDGLSSSPIIPALPFIITNNSTSNTIDEYDTRPSLDPRLAFEMFQGKIFGPSKENYFTRPRKDDGTKESPIQKLARLSAEVEEFEAYLSQTTSDSSDVQNEDKVHNATLSQMRDMAKNLSSRLSTLTLNSSASQQKRQNDLTSFIQTEIQKLTSSSISTMNILQSSTSTSKATSATTSLSTDIRKTDSSSEGVILELYASSQEMNKSMESSFVSAELNSSAAQGSELRNNADNIESRLRRIENFVGQPLSLSNTTMMNYEDGNGRTVLQRLQKAEEKLHQIDDKKLQAALARAKVIRSDLEAAAKAKSKLNSNTISSEDSKVIARLHDQLLDLDHFLVSSSGASSILTMIVHRLSACASLHSRAMEFSHNLDDLERMVKDISKLLQNVEVSVGRVETGMVTNLEVLQQNLNALDERIKELH